MKDKIANILKEYTKKNGISASFVILEDYAEEITKKCLFPIKCKDCKNAYINSFSAQSGIAVCRFWTNRLNGEQAIVKQDDFCSYAERKSEADNPTEKGGEEK